VFAREISRLKETKREDASGDRSKTFVDFTTLRRATVVMQEIQGYQQRGSPALVSRPILNKFLRQQHRSLPGTRSLSHTPGLGLSMHAHLIVPCRCRECYILLFTPLRIRRGRHVQGSFTHCAH
jgi:hypothetical protein